MKTTHVRGSNYQRYLQPPQRRRWWRPSGTTIFICTALIAVWLANHGVI